MRKVDRLRADAVPRLLVRHVAGCEQCDGPATIGLPAFRVEVSNGGARSIRDVTVDIASISPAPPLRIQYPVTVGAFAALNPGEPPAHIQVLYWQLPDSFILPTFDGRRLVFPVGEYTIAVVAHADTAPTRATFVTERGDDLLWRIRQVEAR